MKSSDRCTTLVDVLRGRALEDAPGAGYSFLTRDGVEELSYRELDCRARALAVRLEELGLEGERALLLYPPGLAFIVAFFGALYAGVIAVPTYPPRGRRAQPRLRSIVRDATPRVVLTVEATAGRKDLLADAVPELAGTDRAPITWIATEELDSAEASSWREKRPRGEDLAFLQYTSGSTSSPKGVMVTHRNLVHNEAMIRRAFRQSESSVVVSWLPLYHDMGLIGGVLQPLYAGGRCVLMSPMSFMQKPERWLEAVSRYRATTSGGPNFAYELCCRNVDPKLLESLDLSSWEVAFNGSEPVRADTLERFAATFEPCGFRREAFYTCYGLAEATLFVSGGTVTEPPVVAQVDARELEEGRAVETRPGPDQGRKETRRLVGCGLPWLGQEVAVADPETREGLPEGRVGEIWVRGPSVTEGYWQKPELTDRDFHALLAGTSESGTWLRTGDLGFLRDGELFVTGRQKDLIIVRGRNYYPQDVELSAERSHPACRSGCAAAFSVELGGEEKLVVAQELVRGARVESEAVAEAVRRSVSEDHEISVHDVVLLKTGTLPKTSSGKVRRFACRDGYLRGTLSLLARHGTAEAAAEPGPGLAPESWRALPSGERETLLESYLCAEVARAAGVAASRVPSDRELVSLGLDSLKAVELRHRLEAELGVSVSLETLLDGATVAGLARRLQGELDPAAPAATADDVPFEGSARREFPLTPAQRALWHLDRLAPHSTAYHVVAAARVHGRLEAAALERAGHALIRRHPMLGVRIATSEGKPRQTIPSDPDWEFLHEDASRWSESRFRERLNEVAWKLFDLEAGRLLRLGWFERPGSEGVLLLGVHHIVSDFWSLSLVVRDLGRFYRAEVEAGTAAASSPAPGPAFSDYALWQSRMLESPRGERMAAYWQQKLAGAPEVSLPSDRPRPPVQSYAGSSMSRRLPGESSAKVRSYAGSSGVTLFVTLLTAFKALLYRITGHRDLVVGSPTAGRAKADFAEVVGYFANPVALRTDMAGDPTFGDLQERIRRSVLEAFEHQDYPFPLVAEKLRPTHDPSRPPIVQVMFAFEQDLSFGGGGLAGFDLGMPGATTDWEGLSVEPFPLEGQGTQFDLSLVTASVGDELGTALRFNTDLFDAATLRRLERSFRILLEDAVERPGERLSDLRLLSAAEHAQLVREWNDPALPGAVFRPEAPAAALVHEEVAARASAAPCATALVGSDGKTLSYGELDARAERLARHLESLGVGPEVPVAVCAERSPEMVVGLLAVLKTGGPYLPVDPDYPRERLEFILRDSGARVLVTEKRLEGSLPDGPTPRVLLDAELPVEEGPRAPRRSCRASLLNLAYVIYTSGSTGWPKGVEVSHAGLLNLISWHLRRFGVDPRDRATQLAGTAFDAAVWELWPYLSAGAAVHLPDPETRTTPAKLRDWLLEREITLSFLPTPVAEAVLALEWPPAALRVLLTGGDKLRLYPREGLPFELANNYGPTENSVVATSGTVRATETSPRPPAIGKPISGVGVYLVDRRLRAVPAGAIGELLIAGRSLARGYQNRRRLTATSFIPDPFAEEPGARLYLTGDLARYRTEGTLEFVGRRDGQVKIRGLRVELGEIEAILNQHPDVREAAVRVYTAGGGNRLAGYVAAVGEQAPSEAELRSFLRKKLPADLVPTVFVPLASLPLTVHGKIDRKALPPPAEPRRVHVAPRSAVERKVAAIWADVLGVGRVGLEDDFFEIGGHSLLATEALARVEEELRVRVPLNEFFREPTVAHLSKVIENERNTRGEHSRPGIKRISRSGRDLSQALSELKRPPGFHREPSSPVENVAPRSSLEEVPHE